MSVSATSKEAYYDIIDEGLVNKQEAVVLRCIASRAEDPTRAEGAEATRMEKGSFAGRVHALIKKGFVEESGIRKCKTSGRMASTLRIMACQLDLLSTSKPIDELPRWFIKSSMAHLKNNEFYFMDVSIKDMTKKQLLAVVVHLLNEPSAQGG